MSNKKIKSFTLDQKIIGWLENKAYEEQTSTSGFLNKLVKKQMRRERKREKKSKERA